MRPAACRARGVAAAFLLAVLPGCERSTPRTEPPLAAASAPASEPFRDYTIDPPIDASERSAPCPRVLSAAPNLTEIVFALGLGEQLVGRTRYCTHPPAAGAIPSIGDLYQVSSEHVLALKPEVVLIAGQGRAMRDVVARLGVEAVLLPDATLDDLYAAIEQLGRRLGRPRTAAALSGAIRADLERASRASRGAAGRAALIVIAPLATPPGPVHAAGPHSFYEDLLRRGGHRNAISGVEQAFPLISLEYVARADPDVIIELAPESAQRLGGDREARDAWRQIGRLRAVERGAVHVLRGPQHFLLGPRIAATQHELHALVAGPPDD